MICHSLFKDSFDINLSWIPDDDSVTGSEAADAASGVVIPQITFLHLLGMFTYLKKTYELCHTDPSVCIYQCDYHWMEFHEI